MRPPWASTSSPGYVQTQANAFRPALASGAIKAGKQVGKIVRVDSLSLVDDTDGRFLAGLPHLHADGRFRARNTSARC